jgi:eukaryotic-like serine/threonine-protein kinase
VVTVGQLIADRYELKHVVGTGGMSSVYCAHDTLLERDVALKILHEHYSEDDDYVERFRREARAAAQLSHPGIVTVIDRGEEEGRQFIVFEFVDGETLKDLVERGGPMPVRRALELGLEIGRALAFAHQQGLVHRDVKPQNVLLNGDGRAQVTDFGIARTLDAVGHTETGTVLGTSHYIAPEQARGERVDAQTDVYSFGVVLYELLAGEVPYAGDNFLTVAMRHVNEPVPSLLERRTDCPLRLAALVERCMAKEPAGRPASMDEVVAELQACLAELDGRPDGEATMIVRAPVVEEPRRPRRESSGTRRTPLLLTLLGLALLAAVATGLILTRDDGGTANDGPRARGGGAIALSGVTAYDPPPGDGEEHSDEAARATDDDPATFWRTESYDASLSLLKPGVGLVLDTQGSSVSELMVTTDTPGFTAEIRAGSSPESFDAAVSDSQEVQLETTFELEETDARYLLVWITELDGGSAHVNEVTAS